MSMIKRNVLNKRIANRKTRDEFQLQNPISTSACYMPTLVGFDFNYAKISHLMRQFIINDNSVRYQLSTAYLLSSF